MSKLHVWTGKVLGILAVSFAFHDVSAVRPLHLQNFYDAKTELRTAIVERPDNGPLSIITITRSPVRGRPTDLISHDELAQLLRLLYSLCNGTIAPNYSEVTAVHYIPFLSYIPGIDKFRNWFWKNLRVSLNLSPQYQLTVGHQHIRDAGGGVMILSIFTINTFVKHVTLLYLMRCFFHKLIR